ncbi:hypothetical protein AKJ51_04980, partial [candidate division MSBL1 archaeon SCGC-AAA382A20]
EKKIKSKRIGNGLRNWSGLIAELLSEERKINVTLNLDKGSILFSKDDGEKTLEIVPKSENDLEVCVDGEKKHLLRNDFLREVSSELESNFHHCMNLEDLPKEDENILTILLKAKALLRKACGDK